MGVKFLLKLIFLYQFLSGVVAEIADSRTFELKQSYYPNNYGGGAGGCPLCDSSVYSYCSNKMFHDGCCCNSHIGIGQPLYNCQVTNCGFLYANSCQEHGLIVHCCCNNPYRSMAY